MLKVEIDLVGVQSVIDIFDRFDKIFIFPDYFGNNWLAFNDVMTNLESDSQLISRMKHIPPHIHLIIRNYNEVKTIQDCEHLFNHFLVKFTDNKSPEIRGWGNNINIKITFEVHHGDW